MHGGSPSERSEAGEAERRTLFADCLAGNREQLGRLFDIYRPYLLAMARGEWRGELLAKQGVSDLVQDSILKGFEAFPEFRGSTEAEFAAWLKQILVRQIQNSVRHYQAGRRDVDREEILAGRDLPTDDASPSSHLASLEARHNLEVALSQLPPESMEVVRLRQFENLSWEEIGARLDRSPEAARKQWARAIVQLKKNVDLQAHADSATKRSRSAD